MPGSAAGATAGTRSPGASGTPLNEFPGGGGGAGGAAGAGVIGAVSGLGGPGGDRGVPSIGARGPPGGVPDGTAPGGRGVPSSGAKIRSRKSTRSSTGNALRDEVRIERVTGRSVC